MPLLGRGTEIRNSFGGGTLPAPNRIFNDLATWQMIPFLYSADGRRTAQDLAKHAVEPDKLNLLVDVLEGELGHDLAFAVEKGKIRANGSDGAGCIDLAVLRRGLSAALDHAQMGQSLAPMVKEIRNHAAETLKEAGVAPAEVTRCVMVGGSALLGDVRAALLGLCPAAKLEDERAMTAVADGLALASETAFA